MPMGGRAAAALPKGALTGVIYDDGATEVREANKLEDLVTHAQRLIPSVGLAINVFKTQNLVMDPPLLPRGIFRREPDTEARLRRGYQAEAQCDVAVLALDPYWPLMKFRQHILSAAPSVSSAEWAPLDERFLSTLAEAQIHHPRLRRIGETSWGV